MSSVGVVGAGITGLSVAWHLRQRGLGPVTVYERRGIGAGASGVQPGGVRQQWSTRENCLLARESAGFYAELDARLGTRARARLEPCGYLFVAHSPEALAALGANVAVQQAAGVPSRLVEPEEAAELVPGLVAGAISGAAWCGEDGYFDNAQAVVEAFGEAALRDGARLELAEVEAVEPDGGGWGLRLAGGRRAVAEQVVVAAGWDSPPLVRGLGLELPIEREARHLFYSEPLAERLLEPLVVSVERRFAAKQLANGRLLASDLGARGDPHDGREVWRANVRRAVEELLPQLEFVPLPLLVSGDYDVTPDHQAILGGVDSFPGLWLAAGFSGHGFMMAPAVGRRLAALAAGEEPGPELAHFALERFERAALVPETQVV